MPTWQLARTGGPWDYSTLGFRAANGDILIAANAPDAYWNSIADGPAETVVRYGVGTGPAPDYVETVDGSTLMYNATTNRWEPTTPANFVARPATEAALDTATASLVGKTSQLRTAVEARAAAVASGAASGPESTTANFDDAGFDLWAVLGQSNAVGAFTNGQDLTRLDGTSPRVRTFDQAGNYANTISIALEPLRHLDPSTGLSFGTEFGRRALSVMPSTRDVLLVPAAYSSTGFTRGSFLWKPAAADNINLYKMAQARITAALAAAGRNARFAGILWCQGENDTGVSQAQYAAYLDSLIDGFRTTFGVPDLPFVMLSTCPGGTATDANVTNAQIDTARRKTRTAWALGSLLHDGIHYTAAGHRENAARLFDAYLIARANVLGTAPKPPVSVTAVQSGTSIVVTWVRPRCRFTDFDVRYRVAGSGTSYTQATRSSPNVDNTHTLTGLTPGAQYEIGVRTDNEQGTSDWTSTTITLVSGPAQVTGLAVGSPTGSSLSVSWSALPGATSYQVERSTTGTGGWSVVATPTGTSYVDLGLLPSTAYYYRVSAVNAGGTGTPSTVQSATTTSLGLMLDDGGTAASAAYSIARRLSTSYTGPLVRVRRSSDSTEADIGYTAGGALDTTALLAFVGSGSGFVKTLYDQSGNARHLTQATAAAQPRIVNSGVLDTNNTRPTMVASGAQFFDTTTAHRWAAGAMTAFACIQPSGTQVNAASSLWAEGVNGATTYYGCNFGGTGGTAMQMSIVNDAGTTSVNTAAYTETAMTTRLTQVTILDTGLAMTIFGNGSAPSGAVSYNRSAYTLTPTRFGLLCRPRASNGVDRQWTGSLSELVFFPAALSDAERSAKQANQKGYFSTP